MSSIGTGYDLSVSTYSPDGRLFQVSWNVSFLSALEGLESETGGMTADIVSPDRICQQSSRSRWVSTLLSLPLLVLIPTLRSFSYPLC
jgi:hypothetical protein